MNLFQAVKEAVTTKEAAVFYGIDVRRNNMACCPFHNDRTPSMKFDSRFHCFACGADGDVINFVEKYFGLPPLDAAMKLVKDMNIMLPVEVVASLRRKSEMTEKERERMKIYIENRTRLKKARQKQFDQTVNRIYDIYCGYYRLLNRWALEYAPRSPDEEPHLLFVEAMQKMDYVGYLLDLLAYGTEEERTMIVIDKGKEVERLERRIRVSESPDEKRAPFGAVGGSAGNDSGGGQGSSGADREEAGQKQRAERGDDHVL